MSAPDALDLLLDQIDEAVDAMTLAALWGRASSIAGDDTETGRAVHALAAAWTSLALAERDLAAGHYEAAARAVEGAALWLPQIPDGEPRRRLDLTITAHRLLDAEHAAGPYATTGGDA